MESESSIGIATFSKSLRLTGHLRFLCNAAENSDLIQTTKITLNEPWLEVQFPCAHFVLSWALLGGGWRTASKVLWHRATDQDLPIGLDPLALFLERIERDGMDKNAIGFLCGAPVSSYIEAVQACNGQWVRCLATVGLSNGVRVGDPSFLANPKVGTINILLQSSLPLSLAASIEASSVVTQARTLAVLEAQVPSAAGSGFLTGTGTDCIVIASPTHENPVAFSGTHTLIGHLIGKAVLKATKIGIQRWKDRQGLLSVGAS
jgi:adenosylcobinamide amidohydrolase